MKKYWKKRWFRNNFIQYILENKIHLYQYVVYDLGIEANFAQRFVNNASVKVYAKLLDWFKINTPIGSYNPDWAVLVEDGNDQKLHFVMETKAIFWLKHCDRLSMPKYNTVKRILRRSGVI
ncbi:MAG: hypothetical protein JEZ06_23650 [Anaerolineaceae bacterium]|nr:hypothetical protein [Anaerolineaceae bacterium]